MLLPEVVGRVEFAVENVAEDPKRNVLGLDTGKTVNTIIFGLKPVIVVADLVKVEKFNII